MRAQAPLAEYKLWKQANRGDLCCLFNNGHMPHPLPAGRWFPANRDRFGGILAFSCTVEMNFLSAARQGGSGRSAQTKGHSVQQRKCTEEGFLVRSRRLGMKTVAVPK